MTSFPPAVCAVEEGVSETSGLSDVTPDGIVASGLPVVSPLPVHEAKSIKSMSIDKNKRITPDFFNFTTFLHHGLHLFIRDMILLLHKDRYILPHTEAAVHTKCHKTI